VWRLTTRIAVTAGVDPTRVSPHTLRRTAADTAVQLGVPVARVQQQLRHASMDVTMRCYIKPMSPDNAASHQIAGFYAALG
jgi:integrase